MDNNIEILKWKGIKNDETKKTCMGYLYVKFLHDATRTNLNKNVIGIDNVVYKAGQIIGFSISNVTNKKEAITKFFQNNKFNSNGKLSSN